MSWTEILIEVPLNQAELLSDALIEAGALSVSVEDADQGTEAEQPLFGEPGMEPTQAAWERSRVVALTDAGADHEALIAEALAAAGIAPAGVRHALRPVQDQDWVRLTQSQFEPIHIGTNIWVVPSWHDAPDPNALVLELDPGLAFGTGSHPTTRLCMEWLEAHAPRGLTVLDYGCGSGILAIGAAKYGASEIDAVDIDEAAVSSTRLNAEANGVTLHTGLPEAAQGQYGTVLANILATPLKVLAPLLCERVAPGGSLVLAGILERQADELKEAYAPYVALEVSDSEDGWILMTARR